MIIDLPPIKSNLNHRITIGNGEPLTIPNSLRSLPFDDVPTPFRLTYEQIDGNDEAYTTVVHEVAFLPYSLDRLTVQSWPTVCQESPTPTIPTVVKEPVPTVNVPSSPPQISDFAKPTEWAKP